MFDGGGGDRRLHVRVRPGRGYTIERGKMSVLHLGRWRLVGLLVVVLAVAVTIPAASGAGSQARCSHECSAAALFSPSLKQGVVNAASNVTSDSMTCAGGSIAPGTYTSLTVTGVCTVDQGSVKVLHSVEVEENAGLIAAFGNGPQLAVGGRLHVESNAVLVLGCEPEQFACINDPDQSVGTFASKGTVFGSLVANNPLAVIVHNAFIGHNLRIQGGGGGLNCDSQSALFGSPAYATVEDTSVAHNLTVRDMRTCWLGVFRTSVGGQFTYHDNRTFDPDGNEVNTNVVQGDLICSEDSPAAQVGDSGGFPNTVFGTASGECASLSSP